jgi:DNA modification methylase
MNEAYLNKIVCKDCIEGMKEIEDESVDMVLTDPPYNISEGSIPIYDTRIKKGKRVIQLNAEWDKLTDKEYFAMIFSFIDETYRILKRSGSFICFTSDRYLSYIRSYIRNKGMCYRQTCIWIKSNPVPQMRKVKFMHATELFFTVSKEKGYDSFRWENGQRPNVFYHPIVGGKERTKHPTQKPLWLFEELVKYYSREGDLILDPFMGSGTTAVSCLKLNRRFIGFELSPEYCKIAEQRIRPYVLQEKLEV